MTEVSRCIYAVISPLNGPATNHCPENGLGHHRIVECPNVHRISLQLVIHNDACEHWPIATEPWDWISTKMDKRRTKKDGQKTRKIDDVAQMVYTQTRICPRKWDAWNSLGFKIQRDRSIPTRRPDLVLIKNNKRASRLVGFTVRADHRVKIKENEKIEKYFNLARYVKRLWNLKATVRSIIVEPFRSVPKDM